MHYYKFSVEVVFLNENLSFCPVPLYVLKLKITILGKPIRVECKRQHPAGYLLSQMFETFGSFTGLVVVVAQLSSVDCVGLFLVLKG